MPASVSHVCYFVEVQNSETNKSIIICIYIYIYILAYTFFITSLLFADMWDWKKKDSELSGSQEFQEFNPLLISSWMQHNFDLSLIVSKYLNFAIFCNDYYHIWGVAWLIIVGSRFDGWIYWTSPLKLHLIITVHTFTVVWILNWSIVSSLLNTTHGFSATTPCFVWVWVLCYDRRSVGQSLLE
jgi:hypothetical protein